MAVGVFEEGSQVVNNANNLDFTGSVSVTSAQVGGTDGAVINIESGGSPEVQTSLSSSGSTSEVTVLTDAIPANTFGAEGYVDFSFSGILNAGLLSVGNYLKVLLDGTLICQHNLGGLLGNDHPFTVRGRIAGKGTDSQHYFVEVLDFGNAEPTTTSVIVDVRATSGLLSKDDASALNLTVISKKGLAADVFAIHQYSRTISKP